MLLKNLENMTPGQQGGANQNMNNAIGTYVYLFKMSKYRLLLLESQVWESGKVIELDSHKNLTNNI
jgi:hypothetical protein